MTDTIRRAYLRGDTYHVRAPLKEHGWRWDPDEKVWWKDAEWDDEGDVIRTIRGYAHIRNRGHFTASIHAI